MRSRTGVDFDTAWARRTPARMARGAMVEMVLRPAVHAIAAPRVDGRERLGHVCAPAIFAANHHSHLDTGLVLSVLPDRFRHRTAVVAAADYFFTSPTRGAFNALLFGAVPVERLRVNRRSSDMTADLLADGWSLLIFPEGGRSPDGWGQEFRAGAAYLALRTGRPLVPIHLGGTGTVWPKGQRLPRPGSVTVTFGAPLIPDDGESARRLGARLEANIATLADEVTSDWWSARRRAAAGSTPEMTGPAAGSWRRAWALGERTARRR